MNAQGGGDSKNIALSKEWGLTSDELIHRFLRYAEFRSGSICDTLVSGNVGANSSTLTFEVRVHHNLPAALAVALYDMFEFVSQHEPKIVYAVMTHRQADHRGCII
ncbi:hypothetical protein BH11PSE7_BH11PSE7_12270 [soil metagenome]